MYGCYENVLMSLHLILYQDYKDILISITEKRKTKKIQSKIHYCTLMNF